MLTGKAEARDRGRPVRSMTRRGGAEECHGLGLSSTSASSMTGHVLGLGFASTSYMSWTGLGLGFTSASSYYLLFTSYLGLLAWRECLGMDEVWLSRGVAETMPDRPVHDEPEARSVLVGYPARVPSLGTPGHTLVPHPADLGPRTDVLGQPEMSPPAMGG